MVGDIVGSPGRRAFSRIAGPLKAQGRVDVVVANAENAAAGRGLTAKLADELFAAGADVLTLGDHTWDQKETAALLERDPRVVRPVNFRPGCPGRGWTTISGPWGELTVISAIGRVFMNAYDCPFRTMDRLLAEQPGLAKVRVVDLHAEATSEKIVLGRYLDGRISALVGTHTHVQTSDETILPGGTAYLTDLGMTGAKDSALGRDLESVTHMFLTGMPTMFKIAERDVVLEGVRLDIDASNGRARRIERVRERLEEAG